MAEAKRERVLVGEFGRAHGVRGEVRLKSFTGDPAAIASYNPLQREDGSAVVLAGLRAVAGTADMFVTRVEGVATREAAEALTRERLYVPRERLQAELEDDEFLQVDIIGARVEDASGTVIGRLMAFHDFGGGDVIEIAPHSSLGRRAPALLPFTKAFVPVVDVAAKRIVVAAEGLFSDDDDDAPRG
ncbi:16S rRNA processing protein RimM [Pseudochelatococcus lubricantis]|uniref:Ribosome maturation factor RimM n=1 Tax=Pseudochelatococcus lubricantis TaxID=1538102 RepID=A0ABX0UWI2_9HYPH|nr:ribosome maturation factor RimM [Pseudochelatococcus lubricantis]NIJ57304.1 16S rRNA processing protein RimM [Pseudochelatococcus lubricantis]